MKIKILNGKLKGSILKIPKKVKIKPTKQIIRKTLFEIIKKKIKNSTCLDLFAGSGILGMEAISLGAKEVTIVENQKKKIKIINNKLKKININKKINTLNECCFSFIKKNKKKFDIIFMDPPFKIEKNITELIGLCEKILKKKGIIYLESYKSKKNKVSTNLNLSISKIGINGKVMYQILKKN